MSNSRLKVCILPLDSDSFVHGIYGLEKASVRGLVVLSLAPDVEECTLLSLLLRLQARQWIKYSDDSDPFPIENVRSRDLFSLQLPLLAREIITSRRVEIPFEMMIPDTDVYYEQDLGSFVGPSCHLWPASMHISGISAASAQYQAWVAYEIQVEAKEPGLLSRMWNWSSSVSAPSVIECTQPVSPFVIFDPRLVPHLLHPEGADLVCSLAQSDAGVQLLDRVPWSTILKWETLSWVLEIQSSLGTDYTCLQKLHVQAFVSNAFSFSCASTIF